MSMAKIRLSGLGAALSALLALAGEIAATEGMGGQAEAGVATPPALTADGPDLRVWGPITFAELSPRADSSRVYRIDPDATHRRQLTARGFLNTGPAWSPDGGRIAFRSALDLQLGQIYTMDADGGDLVQLTDQAWESHSAAWSPDGERIAFIAADGQRPSDLYVIDIDGSDLKSLTSHFRDVAVSNPAWSPDGRLIAYIYNFNNQSEIRLVDSFSGELQWASPSGPNIYDVNWSPDGTQLVCFQVDAEHRSDLFVIDLGIDLTGGHVIQVTDDDVWRTAPTFSPDGTRIAFEVDGQGQGLGTIDLDGGNEVRLQSTENGIAPDWGQFRRIGAAPEQGSVSRTMRVRNAGNAELEVFDISSELKARFDGFHFNDFYYEDPTFSAEPRAFTLAPGGEQLVEVTFAPSKKGTHYGRLRILSNDPDHPVVTMVVNGTGLRADPDGAEATEGEAAAGPEADGGIAATEAEGGTVSEPEAGGDAAMEPETDEETADPHQTSATECEDEAATGPAQVVALDFDLAEGDQGHRKAYAAAPGAIFTVQLNVHDAPEISGWNVDLSFDPAQVRYVEGSFAPGSFLPELIGLTTQTDGVLSVGGAVLGAGGGRAGDGTLGALRFEVLKSFADSTDLLAAQVNFRRVDGREDRRAIAALATISAEEETPSASGLPGDFNGDRRVDFEDFFAFADHFGGGDPRYDLSVDGQVNFDDFFIFADHFGQSAAKLLPREVAAADGALVLTPAADGARVVATLTSRGLAPRGYVARIEYDPRSLRLEGVSDQGGALGAGSLLLVHEEEGALLVAGGRTRGAAEDGELARLAFARRADAADAPIRLTAAVVRDRAGGLARPALGAPVGAAPPEFALLANYPNPFNPTTTIPYRLGAAGPVRLEIYDALGRKVRTLVDRVQSAGAHRVEWNGLDAAGRRAAAGLYFYRLGAGDRVQVRKLMLVK